MRLVKVSLEGKVIWLESMDGIPGLVLEASDYLP